MKNTRSWKCRKDAVNTECLSRQAISALDGVIGQAELVEDEFSDAEEADIDEDEFMPPGLDFWREMQFETGFFGYFGRNIASVTTGGEIEVTDTLGMDREFEVTITTMRPDRFERLGFDARWQCQDLDILGAWVWGWDTDPISDEEPDEIEADELFTWFLEADYYFKPWLIGYGRYEQISYRNEERQEEAGISRGVVGASAYIRANMRTVGEFVLDAQGNGTTEDVFTLLLDFVY